MSREAQGPIPRVPRAEVRRRLLGAATKEFAERGYADSRLDNIALAAGFTKGAIYSNFGSKQGLFGAVLNARAEEERVTLLKEMRVDAASVADKTARVITQRVVGDTERGQLGLEFAARAASDEKVREVLTELRRAQRDAAATSITEVTTRSGLRLNVAPEVAALILHCLINGLSMEHLADPEQVDAVAIEQAVATTIAALTTDEDSR